MHDERVLNGIRTTINCNFALPMEMQKKILETASELFFKYGLRSVTIDDVCSRLHISKKTFYLHFRQKEELVEVLLEEMRRKKEECRICATTEQNAIDRMLDETKELKNSDLYEQHVNFFYDLQKYYPAIMEQHNQKVQQQVWTRTCEWIRLGIKQGLFRDEMDVEAMAVYLNTKLWEAFRVIRSDVKRTRLQTVDFMMDCSLRLLANEKGWEYYQTHKSQIIQPYA